MTSFFHKESRYTIVWNVVEDGARTVLARDRQKAEYDMTSTNGRRMFYQACSSDRYELLRFGRILNDSLISLYVLYFCHGPASRGAMWHGDARPRLEKCVR